MTVRVYVAVLVGETVRGDPEVTVRLPGVTTPVPLLKVAASVVDDPDGITVAAGAKPTIAGAGTTVTLALPVT